MNWEDMSDGEKTKHIIIDVLGWECFESDGFLPLYNMSDAWTVLQKIASFPDEPFESHWTKQSFMRELNSTPCDNPSYYDIDLPLLASWTPEQICRAAYVAVHPSL